MSNLRFRAGHFTSEILLVALCMSPVGHAFAQPSVGEALRLKPMQQAVDFDVPDASAAKKCSIDGEEVGDFTAWVVRGASGEPLRQFVDSNADNKVDQWRYFKSGVEVYRDIDGDFNGKADQYRWLGTAGTRWGLDEDEDGNIDRWKQISAEEVTSEVIESIRGRDRSRFESILLSKGELQELGLGKRLNRTLLERSEKALDQFNNAVRAQKLVSPDTRWIDFGGLRPGTIPAGTDGSTRDVTVYENVVAMVETNGKPKQLPVGTLVAVGNGWRVIDLPIAMGDDAAPDFVFFNAASRRSVEDVGGISEETQQLIKRLEEIDTQLSRATRSADIAKINKSRADTLEKLAMSARRTADRDMWWMQFVDTVGTAAQSGSYPEGTLRLERLLKKLERSSSNRELLSHATFTHMSAEYAEQLQAPDADFGDVQEKWLVRLEAFIGKFSDNDDTAEAMLQLALAKEFAGEEKDANRWYTKIVQDFGQSPLAKKAAGAKRRLESVGKSMKLTGRTIDGKLFDIERLRGNVVLVHYWATWCDPCKRDMEVMAALQKELAGERFEIVGVNLDAEPEQLGRYLQRNRPKWKHLYDEGGLDGKLASEMGVFTLPVMLLVDQRGRVVNRALHGAQMEKEIRRLLERK